MTTTDTPLSIDAVTFKDNANRALEATPASSLVITSETAASFSGNGSNGVTLDTGSLARNLTLNNPGIVYIIGGNVTVPQGMTLTIDPGQVIKFTGGAQLTVAGTLNATGTAAGPIIFTSVEDNSVGGDTSNNPDSTPGPGNWNGIQFTSTSTASVMNHVEVRYGGNAGIDDIACIEIDGVQLTMTDSIERDGGHAGLYSLPGSNVTLACNLFVDNSFNGVQLEAGSTDTLVNDTIDGNGKYGLVLDSPTATLVNDLITNSGGAGVIETGPTNLTMSYNDLYNPGEPNYSGLTDPTGTDGNISADPRYFNAADLQFELIPGSPAEGAGTSHVSPGVPAPATDILGNPPFKDPNITGRGDGSGYDMGAIWPQQVATSDVDLATTAVSGPATGLEGQSVTVNWTVESVGAGTATGSWHDAVYLSASPVFTPDAILLGEVEHTGDLGPGQSYNASGTFTLPGVVPGNDYYIVAQQFVQRGLRGDRAGQQRHGFSDPRGHEPAGALRWERRRAASSRPAVPASCTS